LCTCVRINMHLIENILFSTITTQISGTFA
jgi:hypothetical protein